MAQQNNAIQIKVKFIGLDKDSLNTQIDKIQKQVKELKVKVVWDTSDDPIAKKSKEKTPARTINVGDLGTHDITDPNAEKIRTSITQKGQATTLTMQKKINEQLQITVNKEGEITKKVTTLINPVTKAAEAFDKVKARVDNLGKSGKLTNKQINEFNGELTRISKLSKSEQIPALRNLNQSISDTGKRVLSTGEQFKQAFGKFAIWMGATTIWYTSIKAIRMMIDNVISLDKSLVELNKVADLSSEQLEKVTQRAYTLGEEVGRTGVEVIDAVAAFKKAGYDIEQSFNLANIALTMTNVADGISNVKEAASSLISILKGLNKEVSYAQYVLDLINYTSNNFAIDADNLTDILERATATLAQSGNTYEQIVGMGTAIYEITRNAEKTGSALVFISTRMRRVNEEGEDNTKLLAKIAETLKKYANVDVYDQNKELRSTYDILKELSGVYGDLTSDVQGYINEALSGTRQSPQLIALLNNFAQAEKIVADSAKATNSAFDEQQKYIDGIEGRINTLKSTFSDLARKTIEGDLVKGVISLATTILDVIDRLGGLKIVLLDVLAIVIMVRSQKILAFFKGLGSTLALLGKNIAQVFKPAIISSATEMKNAAKAAQTAGKALSSFNVWVLLITVALNALSFAFNINKKNREKELEVIKKTVEQSTKEYESIDGLVDQYIELAGKVNKTTEELTKLNDIGKQLITTYGILNGETDFGNKSYEEQIEIIKALNKAKGVELQGLINNLQLSKDVAWDEVSRLVYKPRFYTGLTEDMMHQVLNTEEVQSKIKELGLLAQNKILGKGGAKALAPSLYFQYVFGNTEEGAEKLIELLNTARLKAAEMGYGKGGVGSWITGASGAYNYLGELLTNLTEKLNTYKATFGELEKAEGELNIITSETTAEIQLELSKFSSLPISSVNAEIETQATMLPGLSEKIKAWANQFANSSEETKIAVKSITDAFEAQADTVKKSDPLLNYLQDRLSTLQLIQENQNKELETQEKLLAIEKAREELAKAKMKRTLVLTREGWKYQESSEDVEQAQKSLDDALKNAGLDDMSQAISSISNFIELYNEMVRVSGTTVRATFLDAVTSTDWINKSYEEKMAFFNELMGEGWAENYLSSLKATTTADIDPFVPKRHNGGVVGNLQTKNSEQLTKLLKGEYVLTEGQQTKLVSIVGQNGKTTNIEIGNISLPNVVDADGFIAEITKISSTQLTGTRKKSA